MSGTGLSGNPEGYCKDKEQQLIRRRDPLPPALG